VFAFANHRCQHLGNVSIGFGLAPINVSERLAVSILDLAHARDDTSPQFADQPVKRARLDLAQDQLVIDEVNLAEKVVVS